ncbi:FadR/GntR family transcriptional regulator [Amphiplicatus metriothermophilus]|uniref:Transcriptional regulator, GntR family n=1 Tax=Amphiplicatus metriothermophilus TaxID=1519374 RepID=A0A239PXX8_9PROT|nr:FadR/GntR family transcriptional regulator [Amphiplicatus metriothermophilus]MBB5519798.1 DNA-binding FadR family transcriptional regulator [Amphiplicatus metriothermophilus]SNT75171.1 transcriptional regulator, GntR family [Amphiplicatus metriothermophilus]
MDYPLHSNLTSRIAQALGRAIAVGDYPPGATLPPESELVTHFGASRTVLREAVKMLTAKGLIDSRPRRGTIVKPEAEWNLADPDILSWLLHRRNVLPLMLEFVDVRLAIEPSAAMLAARNGDQEAIEEMRAAIERMRDAVVGDDDPLSADIAFHVAILKAGGNRFFWSLRYMIEVALRFSIRITNKRKADKDEMVNDHMRIFEAIAARDQQAAEAAMRSLIIDSKMLLYEAQRRNAEQAEADAMEKTRAETAGGLEEWRGEATPRRSSAR